MGTVPDLGALQARIYEDIPLARHMGVRVLAHDGRELRLGAPLAANANDKGTAFGGSLYSVAVLAGWALLSLEMQARGLECQVVIQESSIAFFAPAGADFEAAARAPASLAIERCVKTLARRGRARIEVDVVVVSAGVEVARMRGRYVVSTGRA